MRILALIFFLFFPLSAQAEQCSVVPFYDGYSANFNSYTLYSGYIYGLDEKFMYLTLTNGAIYGFVNVPQSVPQSVTNTTNGDTFYNTRIRGKYRQTLMTELCGNILNENGNYLLGS